MKDNTFWRIGPGLFKQFGVPQRPVDCFLERILDFLKAAKHLLTGRVGLSFLYEGYRNPAQDDTRNLGLDFGFNHEWEFATSKLVDRVTFTPSFKDFSNYRFTHESFYELPLADPMWKLRLGLSNDYNSKPGPGLKSMDTIYFTRLVLNWK